MEGHGRHIIEFYASDRAANVELVQKQEFFIKMPNETEQTAAGQNLIIPGKAKAVIRTPQEGKRIRGNAVTIMAEATMNASAVLFQYKKDSDNAWKDIAARDEKFPFSVFWNASALSNGQYWLRAIAYDEKNHPELIAKVIGVSIDDVNAELVEDGNPDIDPNTEHRRIEIVSSEATAEIVWGDGTKAMIPKGAISKQDKLKIETVASASVSGKLPAQESSLKPAGVFRAYSFESGERVFSLPITIALPYPDHDNDSIIDGTDIKESELKLYFYDEAWKRWEEAPSIKKVTTKSLLAPSSANNSAMLRPGKMVEAQVNHFTLFGLFAVRLPQAVSQVIVYPNPLVVPHGNSAFIFDGLPASGKIQIFTIIGRPMLEANFTASDQGRWLWNLRNDEGASVASGAYIYLITTPSGETASGKIALIR